MSNTLLTYRRPLIVAVYAALWTLSYVSAFLLRFEFAIPALQVQLLWSGLPALLLARLSCYAYFRMFRGMWRYTGSHDAIALAKAGTVSSMLFVLFVLFTRRDGFPRSVLVLDWLLHLVLVGGLRFSVRALREAATRISRGTEDEEPQSVATKPHRVLVVGAGDAGELLVREMQRTMSKRYVPVGFVDDNPHKLNEHIHGVPVLGRIDQVSDLARDRAVDEIVIAIPSATGKQMRSIVERCARSGAVVRTVPAVESLIEGSVNVSQLRDVAIEDLLGREPVVLDTDEISKVLRGARVLVTGAGGSIGSEICRQLCRFGPESIVLVERAENALFNIHRELHENFPDVKVIPAMADVGDKKRMEAVFRAHRPTEVFHAAAHKHVPMMEWNASEAVKNNVFGTRAVADLADAFNARRFVMVSTDKAVNPTSVMGACKRVAEIYIQALSQRSQTRFVTVRFGNVLGSAGSVVPIFKEQIARGGPVSVTHPDMKRYFMTIPEACQLVLQAGTMGHGGEIFVLDMGEPVKIVDLAKDLIRLSGLRVGEDVEIEFTGLRPGEKLFEELSVAEENADKTRHPKIFVGRFRAFPWEHVQQTLAQLGELADDARDEQVRARLAEVLPEYKSPIDLPGAEHGIARVEGARKRRTSTNRSIRGAADVGLEKKAGSVAPEAGATPALHGSS